MAGAPTLDPWMGRVLGGRYRILGVLGAGGAGAVYEAEQIGLGRHVALKLMRPELAEDVEQVERFRREALAAAQLGHPHIVGLIDFAEARNGEPAHLVLELVRGRSLFQLLRDEAPLAPARAVGLAGQILAALSAAHAAGIVHRDMKPGNVVIAEVPGVGEIAKVLDFGIARMLESDTYRRLTQTGVVIGTPRYMSPEQAIGGLVDARTDLWAIGVILYAALTKRFPFDGTPADILSGIMSSPVPPMPPALGVPPALEVAVRKALEKQASDRFADAGSMADALRAALATAPPRPAAIASDTREPPTLVAQATGPIAERAPPTPERGTGPVAAWGSGRDVTYVGADATANAWVEPTMRRLAPADVSVAPPVSIAPPAHVSIAPPARATTPVSVLLAFGVLIVLGILGLATLGVVLVVVLDRPAGLDRPSGGAVQGLPGMPVALDPGDAPTRGTTDAFLEDATRRAVAIDPSARLGMYTGPSVAPATGDADATTGAAWIFMFVRGDGSSIAVSYARGGDTYPMVSDVATRLTPIAGPVPGSGAVARAATLGCPALLAHTSASLSVIGAAGSGTSLSFAVPSGPTWAGTVRADGRVETTGTYSCR